MAIGMGQIGVDGVIIVQHGESGLDHAAASIGVGHHIVKHIVLGAGREGLPLGTAKATTVEGHPLEESRLQILVLEPGVHEGFLQILEVPDLDIPVLL